MAFTIRSILPNHTQKADFNGDGFTDLVWHGADDTITVWNMSQDGLSEQSGLFAPYPGGGLDLKGYGDFNGDGTSDLLWQDSAGHVEAWTVRDNHVAAVTPLGGFGPYQVQAIGDFNGDQKDDLLVYIPPAAYAGIPAEGQWLTASAEDRKIPPLGLGAMDPISTDFQLVGVGDFDGDGRDGILFRSTDGDTLLMQEPIDVKPEDTGMPTRSIVLGNPGASWSVLDLADFNGDGRSDILWQHSNAEGQTDAHSIWLMDGGAIIGGGMVVNPGADWSVIATGDYDNDGKTDLMWRSASTGWNSEWLMDGADVKAFGASIASPGDFWSIGAV